MPIRFRYDATLEILFTTAEGSVSLIDIQRHVKREAEKNELCCRELFDASHAHLGLTPAEVRSLAEELRGHHQQVPFGPTALVILNDVGFGMGRMLEILSDLHGGPAFAVFRNTDNALKWLLAKPAPNAEHVKAAHAGSGR